MTRRIAIYGGSFDPFHLGHLVPMVRAQETFLFESVYFVPAGSPPHKNAAPLTPVTHRLAMVAMATLPYDNFFTSDDEVFAPQPTYSVETVRRFRDAIPGAALSISSLVRTPFRRSPTWEMWEELVDSVHLVVLHRAHMWGKELQQRVPERLLPRLQLVEPFEEVPDPEELTSTSSTTSRFRFPGPRSGIARVVDCRFASSYRTRSTPISRSTVSTRRPR